MTSEKLFSNAKDGICDWCVDELYELWEKHGKPEGEDGTTTDAVMRAETLATGLCDECTDSDVDSYNSIIETLFELVDCRHIGSGIWYTDYYKSTEYLAYCDEGFEIVDEYVCESLWDDFCNNYDWDDETQTDEDQEA